jgi:hypothetical protein
LALEEDELVEKTYFGLLKKTKAKLVENSREELVNRVLRDYENKTLVEEFTQKIVNVMSANSMNFEVELEKLFEIKYALKLSSTTNPLL